MRMQQDKNKRISDMQIEMTYERVSDTSKNRTDGYCILGEE